MEIEPPDLSILGSPVSTRLELEFIRSYGVNACVEYAVDDVEFSVLLQHQFETRFTVDVHGFMAGDYDDSFARLKNESEMV